MHTLLLLRHAKADSSMGVADHKRPLSNKGIHDAPIMAQRLKKSGYKPDMMVSSNALRAMTTAEVFADVLGAELILNHELYNAHEKTVLDLVRAMDEDIENLMLIGHNPTWEILIEDFTGETTSMSPCSVVQISFDSTWEEIKEGSGRVIYFDDPSKHED